jgi:predicted CXXCH cytochrome family protein
MATRPTSPSFLRTAVLVIGLLTGLWACSPQPAPVAEASAAPAPPVAVDYVGSARCIPCHADAGKAWQGSQHAQAMQVATPETVLGKFDGRSVAHGASSTRPFMRDGRFLVATQGADGRAVEVELGHTFGVYPLQQYLVTLPNGRKQALGLAWDSRSASAGGQRWFPLFPGDGTQPGHPQFWAGIDQNWNYQCADCHSTRLRKGHDAATDRFNTTWSEMNVACEACHGPGSAHVQWAAAPPASRAALPGLGLTAQLDERVGVVWQPNAATGTATRSAPRSGRKELEVCARCHARRGQFSDEHRAGDALLDAFRPALLEPGLYHVDGQMRDEVYNHASFLQSRMHAAGVTCSDCHEPHSGQLRAAGNAVCVRCHESGRFDTPQHHHHAPDSAGAQCAACHMPTTTYMGVDPRHDHSLRIPRPDRSIALGTPNACNGCHAKRSPRWAADAVRGWYPQPKPGYQGFAEAFFAADAGMPGAADGLLAVVADRAQSAIARASAVQRLRAHLSATTLPALAAALDDADDHVRLAAVEALSTLEPAARARLLGPRLSDPRRAIRIDAARALAGPSEASLNPSQQAAFTTALAEVLAAESFNADRPEAHVRLGDLHLARGQLDPAKAEYQRALTLDPTFVPAWTSLASLVEQTGQPAQAMQLLRDALARNPKSAELQHAMGLALVRAGDRKAALAALDAAARADAGNARFAYVAAVARHDSGDKAGAIKTLQSARQRHPHDRDILWALASFHRQAGRLDQAADALAVLLKIEPANPSYARMAEALRAANPKPVR